MPEFNARRGTALWGFNHFRTDALARILDDLLAKEAEGLDKPSCDRVKLALGKIVNVATDIGDDSWLRRSLWRDLQAFETLYCRWNDEPTGDDAAKERAELLRDMRDSRNRISNQIRKKQYIIASETSREVVENLFDALRELSNSLPNHFKNLSKAVKRFDKSWAA